MFFLNSYFEPTGYQDLTEFLLKFFPLLSRRKAPSKTVFRRRPFFNVRLRSKRGGTDVTSYQGPVSRSPTARMARQTPLGRRERLKMVSLVADTLDDLV